MTEGMGGAPIIDEIDKRRLDLIRQTVAKGCTDAEIASFLELAARYDLDPFAREIWCVKDKKGRLLMMVGRDGLRKVAQRQGFLIDGDVVREKDEFKVQRKADGSRAITHSYGHTEARGPIVGAWCEVTERVYRRSGQNPLAGSVIEQRGFFYAPLAEYMPRGVNEYSPWAKQTSVMILAAAERQALRQATPLSGLLAEGEDESAMAQLTAGEGSGDPVGWQGIDVDQAGLLEGVLQRAKDRGHPGLSNRAVVELVVNGQDREFIAQWIDTANDELSRMKVTPERAQEVADVVLDAAEAPKDDGPPAEDGIADWPREPDSIPGQTDLGSLDAPAAEESEA